MAVDSDKNRARKSRRDYYYSVQKRCYEMLGGACVECGESDFRVLRLDHRYGTEEAKPIAGNRSNCLKTWLGILRGRLTLSEFDLLCANHHAIKTAIRRDYRNRVRLGQDKPPIEALTESGTQIAIAEAKHKAWLKKREKEQPAIPGVIDDPEQGILGE